MGKDRSRVLAALVVYLVLVVASTLVMDWFVMTSGGALMGSVAGTIGIDLRGVTVCTDAGPCLTVSYSGVPNSGMFPKFALATFWGTMVMSLLVAYQAGTRIISGYANESLSRKGILGALCMAATAAATGYLFGLSGSTASEALGVHIERTWAPALLILAHLVGVVTMHWAASQESIDDVDYKRVVPAARALPRTQDIRPFGHASERTADEGIPEVAATERSATGPIPVMPDHLRKKISYSALAAEITRAGIDARREDGSSLLVLWRDVVGVVVRRLPPELEGATFVDIVSTAGATLRILPWTRTTGELVSGAGDERARMLVDVVMASCPTVKLDARTEAFRGTGEAAQLPDLAKLAQHDERLA